MSLAKAAFASGLLLTARGMLALAGFCGPSVSTAKAAFALGMLLTVRGMPAPFRVHLPSMFWTVQGVFVV